LFSFDSIDFVHRTTDQQALVGRAAKIILKRRCPVSPNKNQADKTHRTTFLVASRKAWKIKKNATDLTSNIFLKKCDAPDVGSKNRMMQLIKAP
jgi:hypothetical protein